MTNGALVLLAVQRLTDVHVFLHATIGIAACVGIGYLVGLTMYTLRNPEPTGAVQV